MNEGSWVGLDVHARSVVAGVIDAGSGEVRSQRVPAGPDQTVEWLKTLPAPVRVVYEAGPRPNPYECCPMTPEGASVKHVGYPYDRKPGRTPSATL
jgi:hypothetical protein